MNIDEFFASALKNFHAGKLNEAERQLVFLSNESLSERGIASVSQLLGMVYASAGKYVEAAKAFELASTKNPRDASIFSSLCSCLFAVGKADEAIVAGEKAVILAPNEGDAHYNLANALKQKGDLEKAAEHYRETVEISPELMPAYNSLGVIYLQLGDLEGAISNFRRALEIDPNYAAAQNNLGTALRASGKSKEAISSFLKALELSPDTALFYCNLGKSYQDIDDFENAIASYLKAVKLQPDLTTAIENLGHTYRDMGELEAAIEQFDIAKTDTAKADALRCLFALERYDELYQRVQEQPDQYNLNIGASAVCTFASEQLKCDNPHPFCPLPQEFLHFAGLSDRTSNLDTLIDGLIDELRRAPSVWNPITSTTQSGFQTQGNLFDLATENILVLKAIIENEIQTYRDKFAGEKCLFVEAWPEHFSLNAHSVRLQKSGFQSAHIHAGGWLSGVVYLQLLKSEDEDEGAIVFGSDGYDHPLLTNDVAETLHRPAKGDLVFFPSSLFHRTVPITREGERIIIAFDVVPLA